MPHADPDIQPNCPKCPRKLAYITSTGQPDDRTHVYECPEHGRWLLPPHGRFVPQPELVH